MEKLQEIQKLYENVSNLTEREQKLLEILGKSDENFLGNLSQGKYRILQFIAENFDELAENLRFLIPEICQTDRKRKLAIEKFDGNNLTKSELLETFETLKEDLTADFSVFIGIFSSQNELFEIYQEEKNAAAQNQTFSEFSFREALVKFDSKILSEFQEKLLSNPEEQKLVKTLYRADGNVAKSAKLLYMHRNTLISKIKKFEQKYGFQLSGSDLTMAYSLI